MGKYKIAKSGIIEQDGEFICTSSVVELLNQKDARIKELEECIQMTCTIEGKQEIDNLKQQLKEANEVINRIKDNGGGYEFEEITEYQAKYKG